MQRTRNAACTAGPERMWFTISPAETGASEEEDEDRSSNTSSTDAAFIDDE